MKFEIKTRSYLKTFWIVLGIIPALDHPMSLSSTRVQVIFKNTTQVLIRFKSFQEMLKLFSRDV